MGRKTYDVTKKTMGNELYFLIKLILYFQELARDRSRRRLHETFPGRASPPIASKARR